jgi:hypothetical protein
LRLQPAVGTQNLDMATSSHAWNFGHRRQSFHAFEANTPLDYVESYLLENSTT